MRKTWGREIIFFSMCLADGSRSAICAMFYAAKFGKITEEDKKWIKERLELVEKKSCKGNVYHARVSMCKTSTGFLFAVRLVKMKRLSCPGCEKCNGFDDRDNFEDGYDDIQGISEAENGKLYRINYKEHRDYESGIVDDYDLVLQEVK